MAAIAAIALRKVASTTLISSCVALAGFFRKDNRKKDPLEGFYSIVFFSEKMTEKRPGTRKCIEEMRGTNNLSLRTQSLLPDGSLTAVM